MTFAAAFNHNRIKFPLWWHRRELTLSHASGVDTSIVRSSNGLHYPTVHITLSAFFSARRNPDRGLRRVLSYLLLTGFLWPVGKRSICLNFVKSVPSDWPVKTCWLPRLVRLQTFEYFVIDRRLLIACFVVGVSLP